MKVLVAAASKHGSTMAMAAAIGDALRRPGIHVEVMPVDDVEGVDGYEGVVLGSAVYAGHWMKPAKEFVERFGEECAAIPVWLFSSGPLGDPPKPEEDPIDAGPMIEATGALAHRVFPGALFKDRLGFGERTLVKAVHAPYGDFRAWDDLRSWADEIAGALAEDRAPTLIGRA